MSRIALLVGAVPQRCSEGPIVRLLPGMWVLRIEGQDDSILALNPYGRIASGQEVLVHGYTDVQMAFLKRGTENFINVFAEKVA